jgi:hypothetical protein
MIPRRLPPARQILSTSALLDAGPVGKIRWVHGQVRVKT